MIEGFVIAAACGLVLTLLWMYKEKMGLIWAFIGAALTGLIGGVVLLLIADRKRLKDQSGFELVVTAGAHQLEKQHDRLSEKIANHYKTNAKLPKLPLDPGTSNEDPIGPDPDHVAIIDAFGGGADPL